MVQKIADRISRQCISAELCPEGDYETLAYVYRKIINYVTQSAILLVITLLFGLMLTISPFVLFYCVLRPKAGGAHDKTHIGRAGAFTVMAAAAAAAARCFPMTLDRPASLASARQSYIPTPRKRSRRRC